MQLIEDLANTLGRHAGYALLILAALNVVLLLLLAGQYRRYRKIHRRWGELMRGGDGRSLEGLLQDHVRTTLRMEADVAELLRRTEQMSTKMEGCVQQVGIVRFDAFEDVGGEQSFALALMNDHGDGAVISTLYGRMEGRVYAKPLRSGSASQNLTNEEQHAIVIAQGGSKAAVTHRSK